MTNKRRTTRAAKRGADAGDDRRAIMLSTSIDVMRWRLREAATHIDEAADAMDRGDPDRALDRLLEIEPLVYEVERVLSAAFLIARETGTPVVDRSSSSP
jgi:hypothetical protein